MTGTTAATATQTLAEAEANLLAARNAADRARRDEAAQEVLRLRARIAVLKPALEELNVNVKIATNKRLDLHYKIADARAQIASWSAPLDPLAFPSEAKLADRQQQAELWRGRLDRAVKLYAKVSDYEGRSRRGALDMASEYRTLLYTYNNYLTIAEGGEPGYPAAKSGLSNVKDNFLTVPGSLDHEGFPAVVVPAPGARRILADGTDPKDERGVWERL
jgi:hypothetical protein